MLNRGTDKVFIHAGSAGQQGIEVVHAQGDGNGQANGRPQRVAAAYPIPHGKDIGFVDTKLQRRRNIARYRHVMLTKVSLWAALG